MGSAPELLVLLAIRATAPSAHVYVAISAGRAAVQLDKPALAVLVYHPHVLPEPHSALNKMETFCVARLARRAV